MHPNITAMYRQRLDEMKKHLKARLYPEAVPLEAEYGLSDEPVRYEDRKSLQYRKIGKGEIWAHKWQSGWFHLSVMVPEHFAGRDLCLRIDTSGETLLFDAGGTPEFSFTGFCVWDSGFRRDTYAIGRKNAGEKLEYWLEAAANGLFGVIQPEAHEIRPLHPDGHFDPEIKCLELSVYRPEVHQLLLDLEVLCNLYDTNGPDTRRGMRLLHILNHAADLYNYRTENVPKVRKYLAEEAFSKHAGDIAMRAVCIGHAHIDVGWLWPVRESIRKAARTFATQLKWMERYPDYTFGASQAELYQMVKDHYPALFEKIRRRVSEGRWEIQGGMWVEADCNLTSGESLVRQFLHGKNFFRDEFGVEVRNLWIPDVFGYSAALPQIIRKAGCRFFLTQKMSWNKINQFPHHTFRWRGIDGTEILTHFPPEDSYNAKALPKPRIKAENSFPENGYLDEFMSLVGIGDGGGGPSMEYIERNERMKDLDGCPRAVWGRADAFFERLEKHNAELPCWSGELYLEVHRGTLTSQARVKRGNRQCEQALTAWEFMASLLPSDQYPADELKTCWRKLLLNQFHDILPGSSIRLVYERTWREHAEILAAAENGMKQAAAKLFSACENTCTAVNTLSCEWNGLLSVPESWQGYEVFDPDGKSLPVHDGNQVLITIPASSWISFRRGKKVSCREQQLTEPVLENERIRYTFDREGRLISAYDKTAGSEIMEAPGNRLALYQNLPPTYDAWDMEIYYQRDELGEMTGEWNGGKADAAGAELRFVFRSEKSTLIQRIVLRPDSRRLDFITEADWHESRTVLRTEFPTVIRGRAVYDIQYGQVERPTSENTSWEQAQFEVCGQRYADLSSAEYGAALLNDCKYGYRIKEGTLSLSLLSSPKYPDWETDQGKHVFCYSFLPHPGSLDTSSVQREAACLNRIPFLAGNCLPAHGMEIPCRIESEGVSLEVIKKAERDDSVIVRLVEIRGRHSQAALHFAKPVVQVTETDLMEWHDSAPLPLQDHRLRLTLKPFEIMTLRLRASVPGA